MLNRNELDPDRSPKARFGVRLRALRDERGWTQEELAERLGYSGTHISAVENGRRPPTPRFATTADKVLGTGGRLERQGRSLRQPALMEGFPEYVGHEAQAAEIRLYEVGVVPGLLQTPEYARVLAETAVRRGLITAEQANERVALVAQRQDALDRTPPPLVFVVLDESCIRRSIGAPGVMDAQLDRLVEFAELPNTVLQVSPFDMQERPPIGLPFYILTLLDRKLMSYAESAHRGHLERDTTSALPLLAAYHQLQAEARSQASSMAMLNQLRKGTL
ncbi:MULTISPECIES: helix-turn-helix domain-containing protein [Streptomyces]|uniref:Helix-turn-helix transcriptional regulator n=2 Tax=Streptomyces rimosus subsp. rimosus TaxID=132474 RepID=A0A8A1V071_STRR1|nr:MULTISPECIES: helix-turn-helix transcriptional regulator [Streptomyces]KOG76895.1 DNA-binding protein [Kitasatospora aureofaciens]MYT45028.1 helix-turn-helix domain-containing protein [Streptomyces sp. SID5471]KEF07360.1 DNA-binding protein [Streptomyces rimosus]KEF19681.1 DNA-binding protein [Streptomyces rimosus]KOT33796.1 DNA-binding protein [Streptomyces rimosus subsp. rimosus]